MRSGGFLSSAVLVAALVPAAGASAETIVESGTGQTTWTAAGSPYVVNTEVTFDDLTVEAGTLVQAAYVTAPAIIVNGAFIVRGTEERPVVFEKAGGGSIGDTWGGVEAATFDVTGAIFRNAESGVFGGSSSAPGRVVRSTFDANVYGLQVRGDLIVDQVRFLENGTAIFGLPSGDGDQVLVGNTVVTGGNGLVFIGSVARVSIFNTTFAGTYAPIASETLSTITNSILFDCTFATTGGQVNFWHSLLWQTGNPITWSEDPSVLRADPKFVSETDLRLAPGSPCIDSGSAEGAPDHDVDGNPRPVGAGFDMGAFEHSPPEPEPPGEGGAAGADGGTAGVAGRGDQGGTAGRGDRGGAAGRGEAGAGGSVTGGSPSGGAGSDGAPAGGRSSSTGGSAGGTNVAGSTGGPGTSGGTSGGAPSGKVVRTSGCGCRVAGEHRTSSELAALLMLAALLGAARRRAHRAHAVV